ncbi:ATP-binding protein [Hymenobacter cellulosilyticus]|uniref:ATP-binding protein n=1 Tax=Hymenobacter cellulosilyticus TaxID=2932248 RepID=A0A8T9QHE4_9BACT|nr:ATP-binding protein [Hymenobacter cellulosilyticus]UOQ75260.1 ATP-binding protein [Hymenobacter cellulosilyticus]
MDSLLTQAFSLASSIEKRLNALQSGKGASDREVDPEQLKASLAEIITSGSDDTYSDPDGNVISDITDKLLFKSRETAALIGWFDPDSLFSASVQSSTKQAVLNRLATFCLTEIQGDKVKWLLKHNQRKKILAEFVRHDLLPSKLRQRHPRTDRFGKMLRRLLQHGANLNLEKNSREDMLALASAMEATASIGISQPDVTGINHLRRNNKFLAEYRVLLKNGFYGRAPELKRLRAFLSSERNGRSIIPPRSLVLTGIGGAGKSTLLAKFALQVLTDRKATIVVLDFDRPGVDYRDLYWLEKEIVRQIGEQAPGLSARTDQIIQDARERNTDGAVRQFFTSYESVLSYEISELLKSSSAGDRPLLLVLDTFEEVVHSVGVDPIYSWLAQLTRVLHPVVLKVIFSGRLPESFIKRYHQHQGDVIFVDELEPGVAEKVLRKHNVSPMLAKRIVESKHFPRRPLELKLLASIASNSEDDTVFDLEKEVLRGGKAAKDLFAGIVYRRVLLRISDERARALAYPGLILRYVTADLIRDVVIPTLQSFSLHDVRMLQVLSSLDSTEAIEQALTTLCSYTWLVSRDERGRVWHQKDLRNTMLKAISGQEQEKADAVHMRAMDFFNSRRSREEWSEGMYHQLMLCRTPHDGGAIELADVKESLPYISAALSDLPKAAATLVRFVIDSHVPDEDVRLLPDRYLPKAYNNTGLRLLNDREFGRALDLLQRGIDTKIAFSAGKGSAFSLQWEWETLFVTARWGELRGRISGVDRKRSDMHSGRSSVSSVYFNLIIAPPAYY